MSWLHRLVRDRVAVVVFLAGLVVSLVVGLVAGLVAGIRLTVSEGGSPTTALLLGLAIALAAIAAAAVVSKERRKTIALELARAVWDVPIGVFVSTIDGRLVEANKAYLTMFGYDSVEAARDFDETRLWPTQEDRERLINQLRTHGQVDGFETDLVRLDGSEFPAKVWVRMVPETGELRGAVEDVTEGRAARLALEESRDRFRALFESSPTPTQIQDLRPELAALEELRAAGVEDIGAYFADHPKEALRITGSELVVGSNPAMVALLGAEDAAQLDGPISQRPSLLQTEETAVKWLQAFAESPEGGTCRLPMILGGRLAVFQLNWAVPNSGGIPDYSRAVVTFVDITEIEGERQRFEALFESSPVALRLIDAREAVAWANELAAAGVDDMHAYLVEHPSEVIACLDRIKVVAANRAAERLFGASRESLLGPLSQVPNVSLNQPKDVSVRVVSEFVSGSLEQTYEGDLESPGGARHVQVRLIVPTVAEKPDFGRMVSAYVDITEVEMARRAAEEVSELKSRLIASVSHELRTPLSAIVGYAQILEGESSTFPPEHAEMVATIASTSLQMAGIIEDLLASARADLGDLAIAAKDIRLHVEAKEALPTVDFEGREVSVVGDEARAWADPGRVRQIVRNLVANAVRYGAGSIRIETAFHGSRAVLRVRDRGLGVPSGSEERIFEPYWTAAEASGHTESIGLGLSLSRQLARRMGGELTYRREGDETVFELSLPVDPPWREKAGSVHLGHDQVVDEV